MFLAENRLIFFWKHIRSVCCFSMTALFADNVNFSLFFVCRTILCGEFIACFTYFNCNVDITGLGRNGSFFKIFCDHTAASWIVITNLDFQYQLMNNREFCEGKADTGFIERLLKLD